jgi:hypothetical protein
MGVLMLDMMSINWGSIGRDEKEATSDNTPSNTDMKYGKR